MRIACCADTAGLSMVMWFNGARPIVITLPTNSCVTRSTPSQLRIRRAISQFHEGFRDRLLSRLEQLLAGGMFREQRIAAAISLCIEVISVCSIDARDY